MRSHVALKPRVLHLNILHRLARKTLQHTASQEVEVALQALPDAEESLACNEMLGCHVLPGQPDVSKAASLLLMGSCDDLLELRELQHT